MGTFKRLLKALQVLALGAVAITGIGAVGGTPSFGPLPFSISGSSTTPVQFPVSAQGFCTVMIATGSNFGGGLLTAATGDGTTFTPATGVPDLGSSAGASQTISTAPAKLVVPVSSSGVFELIPSGMTGASITGTVTCSGASGSLAQATAPLVVPTSPSANNYLVAQAGTATPQPGTKWNEGLDVTSALSPTASTALMSSGDYLSSETTAKGRYWAGQAASASAVGVVYLALSELQAANALGPNAGDIVTVTINGHAVPYTILAGDTTVGTLASSIAAAINADGTSNAIVTAAGSSSGTIGLVTITAKTAGICCRYSLTSSVSGSTDETAAAFPLLDIPGNYVDYGKNVTGWTLSTNLGNYTFDHSGNFVGPAGHNLVINEGAGAPSALAFNFNAPGNFDGIAIYDGTSTLSHADLLYPMNVHIITGPLEEEICVYTANNCTSAPTNASYVGEWMNINGSATGPTQHEIHGHCTAGTTCTVNFTYNWTSATSYDCTATAEGAADAPYISTKTAAQIVFTGSTSVIRDFICSGI